MTEGDREVIRAAFVAHGEAISLLEQAAACPDYNDQRYWAADPQTLISSQLPTAQSIRVVANVLRARARLLAAEGDVRGAVHASVVLFRIVRLYEREPPLLVNYLVTTACRGVAVHAANGALRRAPVPDSARDELERELTLDDGLKGFQQALKTELANVIENFDAILRNWGNRWRNPFVGADQCALLDLLNEQLELADRPYSDAVRSFQSGKPGLFASLRPMTGLMAPGLYKIREAMCRVRAQMRCLRVLNALLLRNRSDESRVELTDLGLPVEAITDPYNGERLQLKKLPEGWLIYAVGENLIDDGGVFENQKDVGLGAAQR